MMWTVGMANRDPERGNTVRNTQVSSLDLDESEDLYQNAARTLNGNSNQEAPHRPRQEYQPQDADERTLTFWLLYFSKCTQCKS